MGYGCNPMGFMWPWTPEASVTPPSAAQALGRGGKSDAPPELLGTLCRQDPAPAAKTIRLNLEGRPRDPDTQD